MLKFSKYCVFINFHTHFCHNMWGCSWDNTLCLVSNAYVVPHYINCRDENNEFYSVCRKRFLLQTNTALGSIFVNHRHIAYHTCIHRNITCSAKTMRHICGSCEVFYILYLLLYQGIKYFKQGTRMPTGVVIFPIIHLYKTINCWCTLLESGCNNH